MSTIVDLDVRSDLAAAHRQDWDALALPGTWWTGSQRVELAATAVAALTDDNPLPPWGLNDMSSTIARMGAADMASRR